MDNKKPTRDLRHERVSFVGTNGEKEASHEPTEPADHEKPKADLPREREDRRISYM